MSSSNNRRLVNDEFMGYNFIEKSSSSSILSNNLDLLTKILLYLPVKSLLVFKSVSKQWSSLISDSSFIRNHFLRNSSLVPGFYLNKQSFDVNPEFEYIFIDNSRKIPSSFPLYKTLTFVNDPAGIKIEQSCNGLLCCSSFRSTVSRRNYYIYNPSTKNYKLIHGSQDRKNGFLWICSLSIAFDPLKSPYYKVICIWKYDTTNYQIEIYSSKTSSWRVSGCPISASSDIFYSSGIYWNGSLHWVSLRDSSIYFDVDREVWKTMPMPTYPDTWDRMRIQYFGENKGRMHLILTFGSCITRFDVLEMDIKYTMWNIKYHVDLEALTSAYRRIGRDNFEFSILLVEEIGEEKDTEDRSLMLIFHIPNMILSYDIKKMSFKKLQDISVGHHKDYSIKYRWFDVYQYSETLSSV